MEARAELKYLRITPRKVRVDADLIRGNTPLPPSDAEFYVHGVEATSH